MIEFVSAKALGEFLTELGSMEKRHPAQETVKGWQDFVTDRDIELDLMLIERLPAIIDAPVLSEERIGDVKGRYSGYWMVDPLDGTSNAIAGLPIHGTSVAFIDDKGPRIAGIWSELDGVVWTAVRGGGTQRGGRKWRLPPEPAPAALLVLSTGLLDALFDDNRERFEALRRFGKIRNIGAQSLHLCGVAAGQFIAAASCEARIWDEAAGGLIIREAGGIWVSSADDADWTDPQLLMMREQRSIAAHALHFDSVRDVLLPFLAEGRSLTK